LLRFFCLVPNGRSVPIFPPFIKSIPQEFPEEPNVEKVRKEQYAEAVDKFVDLALQQTSGGRVAAQVLLSTYNGSEFQLDLASMGNLDRENFETAMTIIRGRYETGREPHNLIANGSKVFRGLWDTWFALHVIERGKATCPTCDGGGELWLDPDDEKDDRTKPCPRCAGKRRVCGCSL
jgi:hypothetical protein